MTTDPSVAIVILNWNGRAYLEQFLPSVMASGYSNYKVVLADNASTDGSVAFVRDTYPSIEILLNPVNEGFAKGYNTALKRVSSDYYILLNSDVEVMPGWIDPVITLMESDPLIAACQPKIRAFKQKELFEYAGASGGWLDSFGYPFSRGRVFDVCEADHGQYDDTQQVFWATGAALFVRSAIYHEMQGLDEFFFAHQEEIDLCWRMQLKGYKIYVEPKSVVFHVGGGTLAQGSPQKEYLNFRNNLVMLAKNFPLTDSLWKIPFRVGLDAIAAWKQLFGGRPDFFMAIAKAHLHFIRWIFVDRKKSLFVKKPVAKPAGVYKGLVIWDYFIKRKRKFSEIVRNKN